MREGISRKGGELGEGAEMLLRKKHQQSIQNRQRPQSKEWDRTKRHQKIRENKGKRVNVV